MLVIDSGQSRTEVCRRAVETLRQANVMVLGVVLNKLSLRRASGYYYYYYYYSQDHGSHSNGHSKGHKRSKEAQPEASKN